MIIAAPEPQSPNLPIYNQDLYLQHTPTKSQQQPSLRTPKPQPHNTMANRRVKIYALARGHFHPRKHSNHIAFFDVFKHIDIAIATESVLLLVAANETMKNVLPIVAKQCNCAHF